MPLDRIAIPYVSGRFNYVLIGDGVSHVLFTPFKDNTAIYIAKHLPKQEAIELADAMNKELSETRRNIRTLQKKKFQELEEIRRLRREKKEEGDDSEDLNDELYGENGVMYQ